MSNKNRPTSLILTPNGSNNSSTPQRPLKETSGLDQGRSSSSSLDSTGIKNNSIIEPDFIAQTPSTTNTTTTTTTTNTTDSESSDQEDQLTTSKGISNKKKRNRPSRSEKHFFKLFKNELKDDVPKFIESYVCAYQGDILLQGKIYITSHYLCFHSRIIAYVTKHFYRWNEIQNVTRERVAFIFPTAIGIQLKHNDRKLVYASFLLRDQAYTNILIHWNRAIRSPSLPTFPIGDNADGDDIDNEGTLKADGTNPGQRRSKIEQTQVINGNEKKLLEICLDKNLENDQRPDSVSLDSSNEKLSIKKPKNSVRKRIASPSLEPKEKVVNGTDKKPKPNRKLSKLEKRTTSNERNEPKVIYRTRIRPAVNTQNTLENQPGPVHQPTFDINNSVSDSTPDHRVNTIESTTVRSSNPVIHQSASLFRTIYNYVLSLSQQLRSYPMKTTMILLLFLMILIFHAFYLIQLSYRIEDRLQSLYRYWPSKTIKNTFLDPSMKNSGPTTN